MSGRDKSAKAAKFGLRFARGLDADLGALAAVDEALIDAALAAVDDLTHGRQRGKLLGDRHVTGDLTGLLRLRFDLPAVHPTRFRIVNRSSEQDTGRPPMIEVLAVGERADQAVYRDVLTRLGDTGVLGNHDAEDVE